MKKLDIGIANFVSVCIFTDPGYLHKILEKYLDDNLANVDAESKDNFINLMNVSNQLDLMAQHGVNLTESFRDSRGYLIFQNWAILKWWRESSYMGIESIADMINSEIKALI